MPQVQQTTTITIDDEQFTVEDLSTEVQQMVQYLDEWRQDESDQVAQLLKTRAALRDLQNSLLTQIQQDKAAAEAEEAEPTEEA